MLLLCLCVLLIYVPVNFGASSDNDIHHTLFGQLATFQDLFINDTNKDPKTRRKYDDDTDDDKEDLDTLDIEIPDVFQFPRVGVGSTKYIFDMYDYHLINDQYKNFTKEFSNRTSASGRRAITFHEHDTKLPNNIIEQHKKGRMVNLLVQFLMHAKYELGKALTQREVIRKDKRYQLGYLFNRLRRLKTELFKMVGVSYNQNRIPKFYKYYTVRNLMRSYERVVHFDIDIRDTCDLIKEVFSVPKFYDTYGAKKEDGDKDGDKDGNKDKGGPK
ncbi:uncharacterized protein LOC118272542 [Spodoptera frugiperda]|uniref:Uncharacterized protein LOC118272542 n=1 Tax=Spodoptera frugiperda TaxID=7108 RepID=A0A9R0D928_SPOFR|nr:uncharacterized protein LOC118272542 [Spodoptera frugiperda]